jgi:hypothetical protein
MVIDLFSDFLNDPAQYAESERLWHDLWLKIDPMLRERYLWETPWLGTGSTSIKDGNPIFSASSPVLRRGIRIIQQEPVQTGLDFQVWLDTFGGALTEPDCVHELVIACVLSDVATIYASALITQWVAGRPLAFEVDEGGCLFVKPTTLVVRASRPLIIQAA